MEPVAERTTTLEAVEVVEAEEGGQHVLVHVLAADNQEEDMIAAPCWTERRVNCYLMAVDWDLQVSCPPTGGRSWMRPAVSERSPRGHSLVPAPASLAVVVDRSEARLSTSCEVVVATD